MAARAGTFCWLIGESEEIEVVDTGRVESTKFTVWFVRDMAWVAS